MSTQVDVHRVREVLLIDGWHLVARTTFSVDKLLYVRSSEPPSPSAPQRPRVMNEDDQTLGFSFEEQDGPVIAGPLSAIHAVRYRKA